MARPAMKLLCDFNSTLSGRMYYQTVMADAPILYWRLQEPSGTTFADLSGFGRTGTKQGTPTMAITSPLNAAEPTDKALQPSQTANNGIAVTGITDWPSRTATFEGFGYINTYPTAGNFQFIFGNKGSPGRSNNLFDICVANANVLRVRMGAWTYTSGAVLPAVTNWFHWAVTLNADLQVLAVYINGAAVAMTATVTGVPWKLSAYWDPNWFAGSYAASGLVPIYALDEIAIYDSDLDATTVADHYSSRTNPTPSAPSYVDLSSRLRENVSVETYGRESELGQVGVTKMVVTLENSDRFLEPEFAGKIVNYVRNPNLETNATDWSALAGTAARDTGQFHSGTASLKITSTAAGNYGAANVQTPLSGPTAGEPFTASVWYFGTGATIGRTYQLEFYETGGVVGSQWNLVNGIVVAGWQRISVPHTVIQNDRTGLQINAYVLGAAGAGEIFYIDDIAITYGVNLQPYIDGSTAGYAWVGTANASQSILTAPYYPKVKPRRHFILKAGENLVTNPSIETNLTNWAAESNGTVTRITSDKFIGSAAMQVAALVAPTSGYLRVVGTPTPVIAAQVVGTTYTAAVYFKAAAGSTVGKLFTLRPWDGGSPFFTQKTFTGDYQRVVCTWTAVNTNAINLYLGIESTAVNGDVFIVDAIQVVVGQEQPYSDGEVVLFDGYNEDWIPIVKSPSTQYVQIPCSSGMAMLQIASTGARTYIQQKADARLNRVHDMAGWPTAARNFEAGVYDILAESTSDEKIADHALSIAEAEGGLYFINRSGVATLWNGTHKTTAARSTTSQGTLSDFGDNPKFPYNAITMDNAARWIYNDITLGKVSGAPFNTIDATSRNDYWRSSYSKTNLRLALDADVQTRLAALIARYKDFKQRPKSITIKPSMHPALLPLVLNAELWDRYTVERHPTGQQPWQVDCFLEQMGIVVTDVDWTVTWEMSRV